jgi:hypothetical protein
MSAAVPVYLSTRAPEYLRLPGNLFAFLVVNSWGNNGERSARRATIAIIIMYASLAP